MMRSLFRGLGTGLFLLCTVLLFQNCGGQLSVLSGFGNGDPYEGMKPPAGGLPNNDYEPDVGQVDPDQGAPTTVVLSCQAVGEIVHQLWVVKSLNSRDHYLIATFTNALGNEAEKAHTWSSGSAFGKMSLSWLLEEGLQVTAVQIKTSFAELTLVKEGSWQKTISFHCDE